MGKAAKKANDAADAAGGGKSELGDGKEDDEAKKLDAMEKKVQDTVKKSTKSMSKMEESYKAQAKMQKEMKDFNKVAKKAAEAASGTDHPKTAKVDLGEQKEDAKMKKLDKLEASIKKTVTKSKAGIDAMETALKTKEHMKKEMKGFKAAAAAASKVASGKTE